MNLPSHDEVIRILYRWTGGVDFRLLGQGMEGVVYAIDHDRVAKIFDLCGEFALDTELGLYTQIEERLGYSSEALLVYRAAYSLITANAYAADGNDGHFAWCVAALNRSDVVHELLG